MPAVDLKTVRGFAKATGGQCTELARTTVRAIAVRELDAVDFPFHHRHGALLPAGTRFDIERRDSRLICMPGRGPCQCGPFTRPPRALVMLHRGGASSIRRGWLRPFQAWNGARNQCAACGDGC